MRKHDFLQQSRHNVNVQASSVNLCIRPCVCVCECARMVSLSRARACVTTGSAKPREGVKTDEGDTVMWLGAQLKVV